MREDADVDARLGSRAAGRDAPRLDLPAREPGPLERLQSELAERDLVAALSDASNPKPLAGMRIGVIRALFVKSSPGAAAVSDGVNRELKALQALGAELVEDVDPEYPDDPSIPNMTFGFNDAFAEVLPFVELCSGAFMPGPVLENVEVLLLRPDSS